VVNFTSETLYLQGKSFLYPSDRRLGGPQNQSGSSGEEKNPCSYQELNPCHPVHNLVIILSEVTAACM